MKSLIQNKIMAETHMNLIIVVIIEIIKLQTIRATNGMVIMIVIGTGEM